MSMLNNTQGINRKILVGLIGLALATSVTSCSKKNNAAEPTASASSSVTESSTASASPSVTESKKPTNKPTKKPTPTPTKSHAAPAPVIPTATKAYTQTVAPKPPVKLDSKEQVFEKQFTALTKLSPKEWDAKVDGDPLTYKRYYVEMLSYSKGALCSYMATGLDDFTLGSYIANEVSYDADIQAALLTATRKAYGCKSK
jgi:type IV secretory pathway VirB10-like protein